MKLIKGKEEERRVVWFDFFNDPKTDTEVKGEVNEKLVESGEVEKVTVGLKPLTFDEINQFHDKAANVKLEMRKGKAGVTTPTFKYSDYVARKLHAAIKEWKGIIDDAGKIEPITLENVKCLPGWIGERLVDLVDDMNSLGPELEGEFAGR